VEPHARAADERAIGLVEGLGAHDLVDEPKLEMILQVVADAGLVAHDRNAEALELVGAADAGELENLDRADRTGREDHLAARGRRPVGPRRPAASARPPGAGRRTRSFPPGSGFRAADWRGRAPA